MAGQSLLTIAGWWVAWVYALSLSLPVLLGSVLIPGDTFDKVFQRWAREVEFKRPGITVSQEDPDGLAGLTAVATSPAPVAGSITVSVEDFTAKNGIDFETAAKGGVKIHFDKGATEGTLRYQSDWGPDIRIKDLDAWKEPRSFRLWLQSGRNVVAVDDQAMCTVTIDDGPKPDSEPRPTLVGFADSSRSLPLNRLSSAAFEVTADSTVHEPVALTFDLFRIEGGERRRLTHFERTLTTGDRRTTFCLADVLSRQDLVTLGLTDTGRPGRDETYEIDLMAPSPLFPDAASRTCRIVAKNTNPPSKLRVVCIDNQGKEVPYLPDDGSIEFRYDTPSKDETEHVVLINGEEVDVVKIPPGGCGCGRLRISDLPGLVGKGGQKVELATRPGKGCCEGQGGCSEKFLCGPPVPGDYMLIVVNNERLHDPNDGIVAEVKRALADESAKPYDDGAIILNPDDEDLLTPTAGGPDPEKMFKPYSEDGHDVAGQLKRIEEVVARKREAAANPDLRAVVVWPERDLMTGVGVRPVAGANLQPISFLLPDAAASYARNVNRGLVPPEAGPGDVTVRAPKERELQAHLVNVISEGNTAGDSATP